MKWMGAGAALLLALPAAVVGQDNEAVSIDDLSGCAALYSVMGDYVDEGSEASALMSYRFLQFYVLMHYSAEADATDSLTADSLKPLMKAETDRVRGLVESALAKGNDIRMFSSNMADCDLIRDQNPDVFALVDKKIEEIQRTPN
jgi:hypothetical protein